ncbi:MAG: MFS transporter [Segetibacter sp.]
MNTTLTIQPRIYRIAVSAFFFVAGLTFSTWASRIPDIKNALHLTEAGLGLVLLALPVGQLIGLPLSAWLSTRFGTKSVMLIASVLYPLTLVLLASAASSTQLVLALGLFGLWANMINIAMNAQAVGVENLYGRSIMASFPRTMESCRIYRRRTGKLFCICWSYTINTFFYHLRNNRYDSALHRLKALYQTKQAKKMQSQYLQNLTEVF